MRNLIVFLLITVFVSGASAQWESSEGVFFASGLSMPVSPSAFKDNWKKDLAFELGYENFVNEHVIVRMGFAYQNLDLDRDKILEDSGGSDIEGFVLTGGGAEIATLMIDAKLKVNIEADKLQPYAIAGGGLYRFKPSTVRYTYLDTPIFEIPGTTETKISAQAGFGFEYYTGKRFNIFFEGRYVIGFTEGERTKHFPVVAGIKYLLK
ncbi:outer membrane beta-barrel protein [candidate division KSB1 bacterium]